MKYLNKILLISSVAILFTACGKKDDLSKKKAELEKLQKLHNETAEKITALEKEIAKLDTTNKVKDDLAKLISVTTLESTDFVHYIDLQGRIDAYNVSYISPRMGPGQVKAMYVTKGQYVKKGQLLLKLDDAVMKQNITAAKQSIETLKTQLTFAKDLYNRQNNLWKQGIGTEVQLISAKTNVETLEKQIRSAEENIKTLQEQANSSNVYSDVDGVADEVNIRVGETFTGMGVTGAQIKIVNTNNLKLVTDVPENYSAKVREGSKVVINLPDVNKTYTSNISFTSKTINPNNRSFIAEARVPSDGVLRPNQNAQVKIEDYSAKNTIAVPVNTVATDDKGKFVYIAVTEGLKTIARKKQIIVGELYGDKIEVKSGLTTGDKLITQGFQNLYEGQGVRVQ